MEMENLQQIFKDRYGDFSDFSFFFVGNFDEAAFEEYCKVYLANLPSSKRKDKIIDAGIRPFSGQQELRFAKGSSESAYVSHISTDTFEIKDDNKVAMNAMLMVLNEKLRENIREHMSGVYAIQAWPEMIYQPKPAYLLNIWMSCSPERVDELNTAIFATIDSIRAGNYEDRYIVSSKAVLEKRYEENISQNRYWLDIMTINAFTKIKLDSFLDHPSRYARIDRKMITNAAMKYLSFDKNKLTVIMVPEKSAKVKE
jgi:zinc protease